MIETVKIKETFGVTDLSRMESIDMLIGYITLPDSNQIAIDLTGCITDYPTSSKLFDSILNHLEKYPSDKKLIIITDMNFKDEVLLNMFFLDSKFLNLTDKFRLSENEWKFIINELKIKKDIEIQITKSDNACT